LQRSLPILLGLERAGARILGVRLAPLLLLAACAGDPSLGGVDWSAPSGSNLQGDIFMLAYAEHADQVWAIHTVGYDEELHCSEAPDVGAAGLTAELSERAGTSLGSVPITTNALDPGELGAHLVINGQAADGGTIEISAVDEAIHATFMATFGASTVTGWFDATVCD
jgi:hypothetical protein